MFQFKFYCFKLICFTKICQVEAVTVHATQKYFVTASKDNTWCFYDIPSGSCLTQVYSIIFLM